MIECVVYYFLILKLVLWFCLTTDTIDNLILYLGDEEQHALNI